MGLTHITLKDFYISVFYYTNLAYFKWFHEGKWFNEENNSNFQITLKELNFFLKWFNQENN